MNENNDSATIMGCGAMMVLNEALGASLEHLLKRVLVARSLTSPVDLSPAYAVLDAVQFASKSIPQTEALADMRAMFLASLHAYRAVLDAFEADDAEYIEAQAAEFCEAETLLIMSSQRLARRFGW